jgi:nucleotide-binding universal stress UspA family protein
VIPTASNAYTQASMYEHLLVALDGSPAAEQVLPHVRALARAFGSTVTLLRATVAPEAVITQTTAGGPGLADLGPAVDPMPIVEADQSAASDYLAGVAS